MSYEKDTAPLERAVPPGSGFFSTKKIVLLTGGLVAFGGLAAYGFSIQGEEAAEIKMSDVQAANINVGEARPADYRPPEPPQAAESADTSTATTTTSGTVKRKGPPEGFRKVSPVVMRGNQQHQGNQGGQRSPQGQSEQTAQADSGRGGYPGQEGYSSGYGDDDGYGQRGGMRSERRSNKESFAAGTGNTDLDVAGELVGELPGCVVKAGTQISLQTRSAVRTTLPQNVLGYVVNPIEGKHYLGNGRVERCLAIRPGSTILSKINSSGVERGDLRIQACALRLDLLGGGRRPLGCQPAHGADGGAGIEAETDYEISGIMTGIVIEAALASARGLGGLIAGPAGIAVQVGTGMVSDVGSEYVRRELMRPPVLTMKSGAIYGVQLNGDLSLPLD